MRLNESIIKIRVELQNAKLKKSGKNKFAGFDYFELADFLPKLNELMLSEGLNDRFYIKDNLAILEIQKGDEVNIYTMPFVMFETPTNRREDKETGEVYEVKIATETFYNNIPSDTCYVGIKSETETFIHNIFKYKYLL